jgi:ABC-2 type transport system permease protein
MKAIGHVFRYEFKRFLRRRSYLFVSIGIPLIALLIFYGIRVYQQVQQSSGSKVSSPAESIGKDSPLRNIKASGYVDLSGLLNESPSSNLVRFKNEAEARAALEANRISAYYVIAADYLQSGKIDMYFSHFNMGNLDNNAIQLLIVQSLTQKADPNLIARLQTSKLNVVHNIVSDKTGVATKTNEAASTVLVYVFGMILMISAFITSGYLMQSVVEEKESRMVEVLLSSMRPRDLLAGKFIALSILGLVQMLLWAGTVVFIVNQITTILPTVVGFDITLGQFAVLLVYFILGYLLFGSAYAALGALATNMREGPQLAAFITVPAALPFYALPLISMAPNGPVAVVLSIFPLTAPLTMVMRAAIAEVPPSELLISIALLCLTIGLIIWLAGRLFRVNTLLSGQMPRFRDILRLVRESA